MFLAKIKDNYMFSKNARNNKGHWYCIYTRKNKFVYAKQLTHLYLPDHKRCEQVKNGLLKKCYVSGFETPSCMKREKITKNVFNKELCLEDINKNSFVKRFNVKIKYKKR